MPFTSGTPSLADASASPLGVSPDDNLPSSLSLSPRPADNLATKIHIQDSYTQFAKNTPTVSALDTLHEASSISHSANQEIPCLLRNPKVHYHVRNSPTLIIILSQINPVYTFPFYFSMICSIFFCHLCLVLPQCILPCEFLTRTSYAFCLPSYVLHSSFISSPLLHIPDDAWQKHKL